MGRRADQPIIIRSALVDRLTDERVVLVEAPGGYGKTTLSTQLGEHLGCATMRVVFDLDVEAGQLAAEVRRGMMAAGWSDAVSLLDGAEVALDAVPDAWSRVDGGVLVVFDEVQRLSSSAAQALGRVIRGCTPQTRVVLCGRRLPAALRRLSGQVGALELGPDDLRFTTDETVALLEVAVGGDAAWLAGGLVDALDGWPAAVSLAVAHVGSTAPDGSLGTLRRGPSVLGRLIDEIVDELPASLIEPLPTLAALPMFDQRMVDEIAGAGTFDRLIDVGLTIARGRDGWCTMPDPVREALARRGPPDGDSVRRGAARLMSAGLTAPATEMLLRVGDAQGLAELMAACSPEQIEALGVHRLSVLIGWLGAEVVDQHPLVLYLGALAAETRDDQLRMGWLAALVTSTTVDPVLRRAARAEQALDVTRHGDAADAIPMALEVLAEVGPKETLTRARALSALGVGRIHTVRTADRVELRAVYLEVIETFHLAGRRRWEAEALRRLGYSVEYHLGAYEQASNLLGRALAVLAAPDRERAMTLTYYADVLATVGRIDEAVAAIREATEIGRRTGDLRAAWFAAWTAALMAGRRGDASTMYTHMDEVERMLGSVPEDGNGFEYLVTMADTLAGVGDLTRGREMLERARPMGERLERTSAIMMVEARLEAIGGDAVRAEELLAMVEGQPYAVPEQRWIRLLELAVAVMRQGDRARAREVAAEAFAATAAQGQADLPARFEPMMVAMLGDLVPGGAVVSQAARVSLLGRFAVADGSGDRSPPPGLPQLLVALVALRPAMPVDEAIELLWPDVDAATGRSRLRNLLNRVRERSGHVVQRTGELLTLADGVEVDAVVFDRLADAALAAQPTDRCGLARHALSQWTGELLPEHRYVDWLAGSRERLRRRYLRLLDEVITDGIGRGELDDAIRHLEQAIECEPLDEARHVQLVSALVRQGRLASARHALADAMRVSDELGVPHSDELRAMAEALARDS